MTKALLQQLRDSKQDVMESWAMEVFIGESMEQGQLQNATALGGVRVLNDLIEQLTETIEEHKEGEEG